jgi:hypothetical protein
MVALIIAPTLYLAVPLMLPLDVIPKGLKATVGPKLSGKQGRGFVRLVLQELEGAVERAAEQVDQGNGRRRDG